MDALAYGPSGLAFSGASLERLAAGHGTPLYVYSEPVIRERWRTLDGAFADRPHRLLYSVKANSNLAILRLFGSLGAGADVVSGGELARALQAGISPDRIVFAGTGKTDDELRQALEAGIALINVESPGELARLARIVESRAGIGATPIALRVTPEVVGGTHAYTETGTGGTKFGIPADQALELARGLAGGRPGAGPVAAGGAGRLELVGLHVHFGSQITTLEPFVRSARRLRGLVEQFRALGADIRHLNLGGGLGIRYLDEDPPHPEELAAALAPVLDGLGVFLSFEPGRWLIGPAGLLLTRVIDVKRNGPRTFVVVDAAMNDLIRPALYGAHHAVLPVVPRPGEAETVDMVGPICESGDFLARGRTLPPLEPGDLVVVRDAGAYGFSMASNYNSRPRPAEVLVAEPGTRLIRRRERIEDLWRDEIPG